jgi:hypothetical protein
MKTKLFLLSVSFLFSFNGFSQSKKNDLRLTVAGIPLITSTIGAEGGMSGFSIKPSAGYFLTDKTSVELTFGYTTYDALLIDGIDSNYDAISIVPIVRYSFYNKEKLRLFVEGGFGLGLINYKPDNSQFFSQKFEQFSGGITIFNAGIGADYFFNQNFGIQFILPYLYINNSTSSYLNNIYNGLGPTLGLTFKVN